MRNICFFCIVSWSACFAVAETMVVNHGYDDIDLANHTTAAYEILALELALTKTIPEYGGFELRNINKGYMTHSRSMRVMETNEVEGFVKVYGYNSKLLDKHNLDIVRFPIYMGLLGYRVCFIAEKNAGLIEKPQTYLSLLTIPQATGIGWADADILRYNNVKVNEVANRSALYEMTATSRVKMYCRGANETLAEINDWQNVEGLVFDKTFAIHYPNPHFFHVHVTNNRLIERLEKGLLLAFEDGSLKKLWEDKFLESIKFVEIHNRNIVRLENPFIYDLPLTYQNYTVPLESPLSAR